MEELNWQTKHKKHFIKDATDTVGLSSNHSDTDYIVFYNDCAQKISSNYINLVTDGTKIRFLNSTSGYKIGDRKTNGNNIRLIVKGKFKLILDQIFLEGIYTLQQDSRGYFVDVLEHCGGGTL